MARGSSWENAGSGAISGAVAKTLTAPMERVKLVMQNQELAIGQAASSPVRGIGHALNQLSTERAGLRSLWRGNGVNVLRVLPTYGARFGLYSYFERMLMVVRHGDVRRFCAGGLAGGGSVLLTHPLDTVRTRLASARVFADELTYSGVADCLKSTWRNEGIRGLYAGCLVSLVEIAPYTGIAFAGYEGAKQRLEAAEVGHHTAAAKIVSGVVSGLLATTLCYPLDTVRRQMMLEGARGFDARYSRSVLRCCVILWREGAVRRFYRGWSATLLKSVPAVATTFFMNDLLHEALHNAG